MISYPTPKKLFPFPTGWFVLLRADELHKSQLITKKFAGQDVVAFRTESGKAAVISAYCPHMGAHFGHGGDVRGETIRCPFHNFCFDTEGTCTKTGYDTKPPAKAGLKTYTIREKNGFIIIWNHVAGKLPTWEVPDTDNKNWSEILSTDYLLDSHPQETTENSVDIGHFGIVHKYKDVQELNELKVDGPYLNAKYAFSREGFTGKSSSMRAHIDIHVHGLGYSFVETLIPKFGLLTRQYVFPCPIEDGKINLKIGMSIKKIEDAGKINFFLKFFPKKILNKIILKNAFKGYTNDVSQDFDVWQNKVYMDNPALAKGDGPIGKYRQWARQFYEGLENETN